MSVEIVASQPSVYLLRLVLTIAAVAQTIKHNLNVALGTFAVSHASLELENR